MSEHSFIEGPSDEKSEVLRYCGEVSVRCIPDGVSRQFVFENTKGFWVDKTFTDMLGESVFLEAGGSIKVGKYQLEKGEAHISSILHKIGSGGIYRGDAGKEALKRIIASSIVAQWEGGRGLLLTDAQNVFCFEQGRSQYIIRVLRTKIVQEWDVNMWKLDDKVWEARTAVFTPAEGDDK